MLNTPRKIENKIFHIFSHQKLRYHCWNIGWQVNTQFNQEHKGGIQASKIRIPWFPLTFSENGCLNSDFDFTEKILRDYFPGDLRGINLTLEVYFSTWKYQVKPVTPNTISSYPHSCTNRKRFWLVNCLIYYVTKVWGFTTLWTRMCTAAYGALLGAGIVPYYPR